MRCTVALLAMCVFVAVNAEGVSFPVHRVLQYERDGTALGCHAVPVNLKAVSWSSAVRDGRGTNARSIVVFLYNELAEVVRSIPEDVEGTEFQDLLSGNASAVLVVLPSEREYWPEGEEELEQWRAVEEHLLRHKLSIPFYFTFSTSSTKELLLALAGARSAEWSLTDMLLKDTHQLVASARSSAAVKKPTVTNIYGWLGTSSESLPTIVVTASYDSLSAVPTLSPGSDANGSGALALMHIARAFSRLQRTHNMRWKYNILFLLLDGGAYNHAGAATWLGEADARLLSSVELVLSLDSLSNARGNLYLHASRPDKTELPQRLYRSFEAKGDALERDFSVVLNKVNVSSEWVRWPHEHFSKQRLFAATISGRRDARDSSLPGTGSAVFDTPDSLDVPSLLATTSAIGDVLLSYMFPDTIAPNMKVLAGELAPSVEYTQSFIEGVLSKPRALLLGGNRTDVVETLKSELGGAVTDVVARESTPAAMPFVLYRMSSVEMSAYVVKPYLLEVTLALGTVLYLAVLYAALKGEEAWSDAVGLLRSITAGKTKRD